MFKVVFLLFLSPAYAQLDLDKNCNYTDLITNYTLSTIAGTWYQLERIPNILENGDCSTTTFTAILSNGFTEALEFSSREVVNGTLVYRNAYVTFNRTSLGVLNFTFTDGTSYDYVIRPAKYYEYESLVLYSCQNNGNGSSVLAWKLGKNLTQSPEAKNATEKIIASINDLTNATWRTTSFSDAACKNDAGEHLHAGMAFYKLLVALALVKGY
ncbi:uncharacterized protein LOC120629158 [Pararge aegeria]|uniref:uncharacterized protein LOC120629158 n=1 Tax=Pararge aegeria TaxID=116150 RepID=UPI0019CFE647|nr:uncharacterized protein LOC120629158 [Pararge aegeria]